MPAFACNNTALSVVVGVLKDGDATVQLEVLYATFHPDDHVVPAIVARSMVEQMTTDPNMLAAMQNELSSYAVFQNARLPQAFGGIDHTAAFEQLKRPFGASGP